MCAQMCACIELCRAGLCDGVSSGAPVEEVRRAEVVVCPFPKLSHNRTVSYNLTASHSIPGFVSSYPIATSILHKRGTDNRKDFDIHRELR